MSRILLIILALLLFQCTSQKKTANNNYLFKGVNNPKANRGKVKVAKHKSLYGGSTSSNKKKVATGKSRNLYKSAADPNVYTFKTKRVSDIQYKQAYKYDKKGKKNKKHFKNKKG